jgi:hypothetical protein
MMTLTKAKTSNNNIAPNLLKRLQGKQYGEIALLSTPIRRGRAFEGLIS